MASSHYTESERLRLFVCEVADFMGALDGGPAANLVGDLKAAVRSSKQVSGLRQAAGDMVEWTVDLSPEMVEQLDKRLHAGQLPTLTQMRNSQYRKAQRLLAARTLRSESDFRLLSGMLSDSAQTLLSETEARLAGQLLLEFESRHRGGPL